MWCSDCKKNFPEVAGADVQVCPRCVAASRSGKRRRRVPKLGVEINNEPETSETPKKSKPILRIDPAHRAQPDLIPGFIPDRKTKRGKRKTRLSTQTAGGSQKHLILFGLLVFLLGQATVAWAFLAAHFAAWSIGSLVSVSGIVVAFVAVARTFATLERRVEKLAAIATRRRGKKRKKSKKRSSPN